MLGNLHRRVTLSRRQTGAGTFGQNAADFTDYATVWAGASVRRSFGAGEAGVGPGTTTIYTLRFRDDVTVGDRLQDGTDTYTVNDLRPFGQREREWLELGVS